MSNKSGIFIFTRDCPDKLIKALCQFNDVNYTITVIDDSEKEMNQVANRQTISSSNYFYLGQSEFLEFIKSRNIDITEFSFLLRQLGDNGWNLGYARNLALIFGKSSGFENVLFMDDDIEIPSLELIEVLFKLRADYAFTGAHILGLVDDSVLGHIATDLKVFSERMLSGGFMAFNPNTIDHYFMNNYNEDWIWLFLQLKGKKHLQTGEVFQALTNPIMNYEDKVMFQEYGEIALDGILNLYPGKGTYEELLSTTFWEKILTERNEYLMDLEERAIKYKKQDYLRIIQYVRLNSNNFKSDVFKKLFEEYFSNRRLFNSLFNSLN